MFVLTCSILLQWIVVGSLKSHFSKGFVSPSSNANAFLSPHRMCSSDDKQLRHFASKDSSDESPTTEEDKNDTSSSSSETKPMSRLAMAAADWMEEEDELQSYWDRYDTAKSTSNKDAEIKNAPSASDLSQEDETLTTDERLDRYFQSRGIDKSIEKKYASNIENAIKHANSASSSLDAIQSLEKVRSYMQIGSKLGGTALLELAYAYQAYSNEEGNEYEDKFREICNDIIEKNPLRELRLRAKQLLEDPKRYGKKYEKRNFWKAFDSLWS